jgi:hypothetical protein
MGYNSPVRRNPIDGQDRTTAMYIVPMVVWVLVRRSLQVPISVV